jgi:hypothetical protein
MAFKKGGLGRRGRYLQNTIRGIAVVGGPVQRRVPIKTLG